MNASKYVAMFSLLTLGGCATAQAPTPVNRLQIQVAQLERKIEERDREIMDLHYEIKTLSRDLPSSDSYSSRRPTIPVIDDSDFESPVSSSASGEDERIIRVSASPQDVQKALKNAGSYSGAIDGKIGPASQQAIRQFQESHNLKADGIVGRQTWSELQKYL